MADRTEQVDAASSCLAAVRKACQARMWGPRFRFAGRAAGLLDPMTMAP